MIIAIMKRLFTIVLLLVMLSGAGIFFGIDKFSGSVVFITALVLLIFMASMESKKIKALLDEINKTNGTQFTPEESFGYPLSIYFDKQAKKILIIEKEEYKTRVEDFSFIRNWELKWTERPNLNGSFTYYNVRMAIATNDYQTPLLEFEGLTKDRGEHWNAKLGILFAKG